MTGRVIVVTGTGTDIGKTVVTAALAACCAGAGLSAAAVKPVQTGLGPDEPGDLDVVRTLGGIVTVLEPVRLPEPLAPDTAARRAGIALPPVSAAAAQVVELAGAHDVVLVEGAGGLLVRLDDAGATIADLALAVRSAGLDVAVLVVVAAGLGTLNHSDLTVGAMRSRGLEPAGLIVGSWPRTPDLAQSCNLGDLARMGVPVVGRVPAGAGSLTPQAFRAGAPTWLDRAAWAPGPRLRP